MNQSFVRFSHKGQQYWGLKEDLKVSVLDQSPWKTPKKTGVSFGIGEVQLLAPVEPTKILAFGYNYKDLFEDKNARVKSDEPFYTDSRFEPVMFLKGPNTISAPGEAVTLTPHMEEVWVEVELGIVLGKKARNLQSEAEAQEAIFGFTIGNDITALNIFGRDWHLARSKSLDGFCPLGPEIVCGESFENRPLTLSINKKVTQSSNTENRVLTSAQSVLFASKLMTLEPGDVILTGTPKGARQSLVKPGDTVEARIEGLGELITHFKGEK